MSYGDKCYGKKYIWRAGRIRFPFSIAWPGRASLSRCHPNKSKEKERACYAAQHSVYERSFAGRKAQLPDVFKKG